MSRPLIKAVESQTCCNLKKKIGRDIEQWARHFLGFPSGAFLGIQPSFFFFDSINKEPVNSKASFLLLHYLATGKEEDFSVYYRLDFIFCFSFIFWV